MNPMSQQRPSLAASASASASATPTPSADPSLRRGPSVLALALVLCAGLVVTMAGCGGPGSDHGPAPASTPASTSAAEGGARGAEDPASAGGDEVTYEPAYPEEVSAEPLSDQDRAQQQVHSHGGEAHEHGPEGDHDHGEEPHRHDGDEDHTHDDGQEEHGHDH